MSHALSRRQFLVTSAAISAAAALPSTLLAAEAKPTWQIGCYTRPWAKMDYRAAFDAIAEAGYKYVGLMTTKSPNNLILSTQTTAEEAGQIAKEARDRGLQIPSAWGGGIPVEKSLQAGIEGLRKLIDNCAAIGVGNLMMGGVGNEKLADVYYQAIAQCCNYAAEKKIGISVKPHGGTNSTGPQCRKLIERVGHRNFGLWYDPGNIFYYSDGQLDPVNDAATVDGLVVGMSVKDFQPPKSVDVTPGAGKVDFAGVMTRLKKGGFTAGPLIVETLAPGEGPQLLAEAKKARLFLENLLRA